MESTLMKYLKIAVLVSFAAVLCGHAQAPNLLSISEEEQVGGGRLPTIAADRLGQPHIVADGGTMIYLYDRIDGSWRSLVKNARSLVNAPQFYNPHIEIDSEDRMWISGVTWAPAGGVGVILRENASTNPTDFGRFPLSRAGAKYPVGLLSIDPAYPDEAIVTGTAGGWQRAIYDPSRAEKVRLADTGTLPVGAGGEKTAFWISKAGSVPHPGGRDQAVWHGAMGGYYGDYSAYNNSLRQARGQGRVTWANYPSYPSMKDDGAYVRIVSDNIEPEVAYITCDFSVNGKFGGTVGVAMNIYNGNGMTFAPNNLLVIDRNGSSGLRRFAPQSAPAKDGGAFVTWTRGGRVKMRYIPADARSLDDCGPEWDIAAGGPAAIAVDEDGNVHLAYHRAGTIYYRLLEMSGSSPMSSTFAVDFTGDGRDDPAEWDSTRGQLYVLRGSTGFGDLINLPFVQRGDIPVFANFDGNAANGKEVAVFRPQEGKWLIYNGDIFAPYDAANLVEVIFATEGDIPQAGDFNGNGFADLAVFRRDSARWFLRSTGIGPPIVEGQPVPLEFNFGSTNAVPMVGRWHASPEDDFVVWHPDTKSFHMFGKNFPFSGTTSNQIGDVNAEYIPVPADYDGDGLLDTAIFSPNTAEWYAYLSGGELWDPPRQMGAPGDLPMPGKYTYDNRADLAIMREGGLLFIRPSENNVPNPFGRAPFAFGSPNHLPVPADYDASGRANVATFDPSSGTWFIFPFPPFVYGAPGDLPAVADWDNDGRADVGVFRPSTGNWFMWGSTIGPMGGFETLYGAAGDIPIPGDYDGDGIVDFAVYRQGRWLMFGSQAGPMEVNYGTGAWQPIPLDYNDSGATDVAIYNPGSSTWGISTVGDFQWGPTGGIAAPADYNGDGDIQRAIFQQGWWWIEDGGRLVRSAAPIEMPGLGSPLGVFYP
jgi:hypothetical protein